MRSELVGAIHRHERAHCEAAVAPRELWSLPYVGEQDVVGQLGQFRRNVADELLGSGGRQLRPVWAGLATAR